MGTQKTLIFSVSGMLGSGKDTVGAYLAEKYGLLHVSASNIVREESMKLHNSIERRFLQDTANYLRQQHGPNIWAEKAFSRYLEKKDEFPSGVVFTGLRNVEGSQYIKDHGGHVIFVDAPIETRFERIQSRRRDQESTFTLDDFRKSEERELNSSKPNEPNLLAVKDMADFRITNEGTQQQLEEQLDTIVATLQSAA